MAPQVRETSHKPQTRLLAGLWAGSRIGEGYIPGHGGSQWGHLRGSWAVNTQKGLGVGHIESIVVLHRHLSDPWWKWRMWDEKKVGLGAWKMMAQRDVVNHTQTGTPSAAALWWFRQLRGALRMPCLPPATRTLWMPHLSLHRGTLA